MLTNDLKASKGRILLFALIIFNLVFESVDIPLIESMQDHGIVRDI